MDVKNTKSNVVLLIKNQLESVLLKEKSNTILIYGYTTYAFAGALVAYILNIPAILVEAGESKGLMDKFGRTDLKGCGLAFFTIIMLFRAGQISLIHSTKQIIATLHK